MNQALRILLESYGITPDTFTSTNNLGHSQTTPSAAIRSPGQGPSVHAPPNRPRRVSKKQAVHRAPITLPESFFLGANLRSSPILKSRAELVLRVPSKDAKICMFRKESGGKVYIETTVMPQGSSDRQRTPSINWKPLWRGSTDWNRVLTKHFQSRQIGQQLAGVEFTIHRNAADQVVWVSEGNDRRKKNQAYVQAVSQ